MKYSIILTTALAFTSTGLSAAVPVSLGEDAIMFANTTHAAATATDSPYDPTINLKKHKVWYANGYWDSLPWDPKSDAGEAAFQALCHKEKGPARDCLGPYVENKRYVKGFDDKLHECMRSHLELCNKRNVKDWFCGVDTDLNNVHLEFGGEGTLTKALLKTWYDGEGKARYWWKRDMQGEEVEEEVVREKMGGDEPNKLQRKQLVWNSRPPNFENMDLGEIERLTKTLEELRESVGDDGKMSIAEVAEALKEAAAKKAEEAHV